ncbi:M16 family metallopeptidase [Pontibacter actiniarum]|uniref:Peptidase M16 n=1 Tax=Pontibacter actiniarum TaxID=323450 RepID=A0A1X9YT59_9BACT|nr:M16 family metallopeptidase [Pontibacter actiniarum]ARS36004.1 peptidase M16 [Pontibacter actiniarum]
MKYKQTLILPLLGLLLAGAPAFAQTVKVVSSTENIPADPSVKIGKLKNGLTYYIRKNTEPKERAELYLVVKAGSLQESDEQKGLAHFTEHMAFNGTRSFPENELISYLQKAGVRFGADLNAYTGFDQTVYQLPLPTSDQEVFETGFRILADWAGRVTFDGAEIDKERGVIVEEERQRGKNVSERISKQLLPAMFANSRYLERLPIGEVEIIENFKHETLRAYYQQWYRPDLQAVIAVGDFDEANVEKLIRDNFAAFEAPANGKQPQHYSIPANAEPIVKIVTDPEFPYTVAFINYKHPGTVTKTLADFRQAIMHGVINSMLSARIQELVKSGKAPFLNAGASYGAYQGGAGHLDAFSLQVVAKSADALKPALEGIMDEALKVQQYGFTISEYERVKQSFESAIEKAYKEKDKTSSKAYVSQYLQHFLNGEAIISMEYSYAFYQEVLDQISLEEVNRLAAGYIRTENQIVIVQASEKSKDVLPDTQELLKWVNNGERQLEAYVDEVVAKPLLQDFVSVGATKKQTYQKALGTTELVLSNGVKVLLKPTDFKNDEILFSAYSPGGYSLAPASEVQAAKMAGPVVAAAGVGDYSATQLSKMLAGKNVAVGPYINTYSEGIKGYAAPEDFETALQLTYLYFTQPRKDSVAFNRQIENTRVFLEGKNANPVSVFQDTINAAMSGYGPWAASPTLEQLNQLSLDKAFAFYKDRFADASDFSFAIVGNFEVEKIQPLVEKYLGALPATHRSETFKDVGIQPLPGKISKTVYKGLEDKAVVVLAYHDAYTYKQANNLYLKALESALETRLLERLREKESGVYSPSVTLSFVKEPKATYSLAVSFSCASDRVEELISATQDEIEKMRAEGPSSDELGKFVAQEKRQREVKLRTNAFWLSYLSGINANRHGSGEMESYMERLEKIKVRKAAKAARSYLSGAETIRLVLLPEASHL